MKLINQIIFWAVFALVFISCVQSAFGFLVFVGLVAVFHRGIIRFYRGDWHWIKK